MRETSTIDDGLVELRLVRNQSARSYCIVALFSMFTNLLMLTGPIYMLQVYDRVLGSGSEETLVALSLLVVFLYSVMGVLDLTRSCILTRIGARIQNTLDHRVFDAVVRKSAVAPDLITQSGMGDLEAIQRFITSPVLLAFFDLPWTPVFLVGIFIFHPLLGWLAVSGALILIGITLINQLLSAGPQTAAGGAKQLEYDIAGQIQNDAEVVQALGMRDAAFGRWQKMRNLALENQIRATDVSGGFASLTKTLRLFLQSAMLGLGAYLVLLNEMTPGAMIAGSILMGRALAPVEMMLNQWALVQRASKGWDHLAQLLGTVPEPTARTQLPRPKARLTARGLTVVPPDQKTASLRGLSFELKPGQALGVIGASGAGISTLARAVTGVWRPAGGSLRLDAAALENYNPAVLGQYIGYLPQRIQLFDGTVAENIARLATNPNSKLVIKAAKAAAAHDMILELPDGYDTWVSPNRCHLSGGQIQRIGFARAMYGEPVILVLDEPNSNLDNIGNAALNEAIRSIKSRDGAILIMAHRPAAIQECDMLLVLDKGIATAFGPKEEVLRRTVKNHALFSVTPLISGCTK